MGAEEGLSVGVKLLIAVGIASAMFMIYRIGMTLVNKGASQAAQLTADFDDIDKQKYDGMSLLGDDVIDAISKFWDDSTCEVVVCTVDGINAVYNVESPDNTYTVPFSEEFSGVPVADCKGRSFTGKAADWTIPGGVTTQDVGGVQCYDAKSLATVGLGADGTVASNGIIVDANKIASNGQTLTGANGYNTLVPVGSAGYIATTTTFTGSVQKDANGSIRRITFIQN